MGTSGNDVVQAGDGKDFIAGEAGDDWLNGGNGNDQVFGGPGNDKVYGGNGKDFLSGGSGTDQLFGGAGNDDLYEGLGRDKLYGGSGRDIFNMHSIAEKGDVADAIMDFDTRYDKVRWAGEIFPENFIVGQQALRPEHRVIYNQSSGEIWWDADGDGWFAPILIAINAKKSSMSYDDFI